MIKALLFDCFGVLVGLGFHETYKMAGGDPIADHEFIEGLFDKLNLGLMSEEYFIKAISSKLAISTQEFSRVLKDSEQPNKALFDYIATLKPRYKTAIVSNANVGAMDSKFGSETLDKYFDAVIVSGEEGHVKPEPQIYLIATKKLSVNPSECVFVDDQKAYCAAAQSLGMHSILYKEFTQMKADMERMLGVYGKK